MGGVHQYVLIYSITYTSCYVQLIILESFTIGTTNEKSFRVQFVG